MSRMSHEWRGGNGGRWEEAESEHAFQSPEGKGEVLEHKRALFTPLIFRLIADAEISQSH